MIQSVPVQWIKMCMQFGRCIRKLLLFSSNTFSLLTKITFSFNLIPILPIFNSTENVTTTDALDEVKFKFAN